jgi:hypothetical protein
MLLSSARSGTNYFLSMYSHLFPQDITLKEIFREEGDSFRRLEEEFDLSRESALQLARDNKAQLWRMVFESPHKRNRGIIAKIFYTHALHDDRIWDLIRRHCRVIHLIRKNQFDVFVSREIALKTGKWQHTGEDDSTMQVSITIDRNKLEEFIEGKKTDIEWARRMFGQQPDYHEVFYEDISNDPMTCAKEICAIFGKPPPKTAIIRQRRQKTLPNRQIVINYDDVSDLDAYTVGVAT